MRTRTNHAGGILGGITNGMPLVFRAAFKPTASIGKEQDTVDLLTGERASWWSGAATIPASCPGPCPW